LKYLLLIPARGGSKGIKNKNIIKINKIPLICYTIFSALEIKKKLLNIEVVVSTDSETVKKISLKAGAKVPFLRPKNISKDKSPSKDYVNHLIKYYDKIGNCPKNIIILQPTSPLRTMKDILNSIKIFEKNNAHSLISVYEETYVNNKVIYKLNGKYGKPITRKHNKGVRRQEESSHLVRNGAIYMFSVANFKKTKKIITHNPLLYIMKKSRSVNIDNYDDLDLAIKLLS
jgi:CMP-N,N'-diacetyllegionaminic acid synthase